MRYVKILFLIASFSVSFTPQTAISQEKLRIGIDGTHPPFSHRDIDGRFSGFEIDLANELCGTMNVTCEFVQFDWESLTAALRGGKADLVIAAQMPLSDTQTVRFSTPYLKMPTMVVVRKDSLLSGISVEDLQNTLVGVLKSSPHSEYLRVHHQDVNIKTYEGESNYFNDLINRQLDAIAGNPVILNNWLTSDEGSKCCRKLGIFQHDPGINGAGYSVVTRAEDDKLSGKINKALEKITQSGKLEKLMQMHFPYLR